MSPSFEERFCATYGVARSRFVPELLRRSYCRRSLLLIPFLRLLPIDFFAHDRELIREVGECTSLREVKDTVSTMPQFYSESWRVRNRLCLRVSGRRVLHIAESLFAN